MKPKPNPFLTTRSAPDTAQTYRREFELDRALIDIEARTVPLSFSSEMPVSRYFGDEILDHSPASVRLDRLNSGAPLLLNHDCDEQIGVVESATIDAKAKKGRAIVRFSKSEDAEEIFQDVVDGIRRLVSVGYRIHKTVTESKSGGVESVRVTDWEPYEISLVSVPADNSVGVGRANVEPTKPTLNQNQIMDTNTTAPAETPNVPAVENRSAPATPAAPNAIASNEANRVAELTVIAGRASSVGLDIRLAELIANGSDATVANERLQAALLARQTPYIAPAPPANTGTSTGEKRDLSRFSILRGIQALCTGSGLTGIEREMHQEAQREAKDSGIALRGQFCVPNVILNHGQRDMTVTGGSNGSEGGATVATTFGSFIDLLYAKMVLRKLGAQFLTGLVGNIDLPKLLTGSTAVKKTEVEAGSESSPTTGVISLSPNRLGTYVEVSKQLLAQSSLSVEAMIRNDLATAISLGMEAGAIYGGGTTEPTGILSTGSIGSVAGGTHGAAPTWANMIALETAVSVANADMGNLAYLTNPKVRGKLRSTAKVASSDSVMVWESLPYAAEVTTQVPSNLEKGSSGAVCSAIIFGNFQDLVIAQWGGIDIQVDPYTLATTGQVRILADTYYDAAVRRAGSFAAMLDALTA